MKHPPTTTPTTQIPPPTDLELAELCAASYDITGKYQPATCGRWRHVVTIEGVESLKFSIWESQDGKEAVLIFHGSDSVEDWFKHIHMFARSMKWITPEGLEYRVHESWFQTLWTDRENLGGRPGRLMIEIIAALTNPYERLHMGGHSYGAAPTDLIQLTVYRHHNIGAVHTMGGPRAIKSGPQIKSINHRLWNDIVPALPDKYIMRYQGSRQERWYRTGLGIFILKHLIHHYVKVLRQKSD